MRAKKIAVLRRNNPDRGADKISGEPDTRLKQINDGQREDHPDQDEPREVALDLVDLANERNRRPDGSDVENGGGFAPCSRLAAPQEDENRERLAEDQRRKRDPATDRPAKEIPVMRDQQNNAGADKQRSEDR